MAVGLMAGESTDGGHANDGDDKPMSSNDNSFDLAAFHQLKLERQETKRREEEQKRLLLLSERRSCIRWNSMGSPSSEAHSVLDADDSNSKPVQSLNGSFDADVNDKLSARRELLRLGRRYSSLSAGEGQVPLLSSPPSDDGASNSRSPDGPEATSAVTPNGECINNENIGVHSSHYLLLARSNYSPVCVSDGDHLNSDDKHITSDDGSSTASYNTPTPHLQLASSCGSHGEVDDECDVREETDCDTDNFTTFCKAQVLISGLEQGAPREESEDNESKDTEKSSDPSIWKALAQITLITMACALVLFGVQYSQKWLTLTLRDLSAQLQSRLALLKMDFASWTKLALRELSAHLQSRLAPVTSYCRSIKSICYARFSNGVAQLSRVYGSGALWLIEWAEAARGSVLGVWRSLSNTCAEWIEEIDATSLIIGSIYRIEKAYYDSLLLFNATRGIPAMAWNTTLTAAVSCWQHLESGPRLTDLFVKPREPIVITKAAITDADLTFCPNDVCIAKPLGNGTLTLLETVGDVSSRDELSSFWSATTTKGTAFVRQQTPPLSAIGHHRQQLGSIAIPSVSDATFALGVEKNAQQHLSQARVTQSYYLSSYPKQVRTQDQDEKDAFDNVDVMSMTSEFVGQFMKKRPFNRRRTKRGRPTR